MASKQTFSPLRILIAGGSIIGFLGGWAILGNATEMNPSINSSSVANSTSGNFISTQAQGSVISNLRSSNRNLTQLFSLGSTTSNTRVRMRTGGS